MIVDNIATAMPHVQAGTARILGLTSRDPMPGIEAPVIASQLPGFAVDSWNCLGGPANLPGPIVDRFAELVTAALRKPAMQARYAELRMVPPPIPPPPMPRATSASRSPCGSGRARIRHAVDWRAKAPARHPAYRILSRVLAGPPCGQLFA